MVEIQVLIENLKDKKGKLCLAERGNFLNTKKVGKQEEKVKKKKIRRSEKEVKQECQVKKKKKRKKLYKK